MELRLARAAVLVIVIVSRCPALPSSWNTAGDRLGVWAIVLDRFGPNNLKRHIQDFFGEAQICAVCYPSTHKMLIEYSC